MKERLIQLYESIGFRDVIEIVVLAVAVFMLLRFLGRTRGSGLVRGLGMIGIGAMLVAQVIIASLDLAELGKVFDYLMSTVVVGLLVIFQPELRRGLMVLGRYPMLRYLVAEAPVPLVADRLAETAIALSRDCVGALIAVQRELTLTQYAESGENIDAELSGPLIRTIFWPKSPLHDGALIIRDGRLVSAACQLPLSPPPDVSSGQHMGMRHRAALGLSEETDAVVLVVSEETGRISIAVGGRIDPVPREQLAHRLGGLLNSGAPSAAPTDELDQLPLAG